MLWLICHKWVYWCQLAAVDKVIFESQIDPKFRQLPTCVPGKANGSGTQFFYLSSKRWKRAVSYTNRKHSFEPTAMVRLHGFITTSEHGATHDRCEASHRVSCPALRGVMQRLAFSLQLSDARFTFLRPSVKQSQATNLRRVLQENAMVLQHTNIKSTT